MCSSRSGGECREGTWAGSGIAPELVAKPAKCPEEALSCSQPSQGRVSSQPHIPAPRNSRWELLSPLSSLQPGAGQPRGCHGFHRAHDPAHLPHPASRGGADPLHNGLLFFHVRASIVTLPRPAPPGGTWSWELGTALCLHRHGEAQGTLLQ